MDEILPVRLKIGWFSVRKCMSTKSRKPVFKPQAVLSCGVQRYVVACICVSDYAHGGIVVQHPLQAGIGFFCAIGHNYHPGMDGITNANPTTMMK
jgi:hypothetical protein